MSKARVPKLIFITGTDTGVGKTLLTAMMLKHLRDSGCHALAMKPFCSGGRADVELLQSVQPGELSDDEVNPFYFSQPIAPFVALQKRQEKIRLNEVIKTIRHVEKKCVRLLVEGSGGLLVPLGPKCFVADLIQVLNPKVILVARNQLGTINHTLLTLEALHIRGLRDVSVVLMCGVRNDLSSQTNRKVLSKLIGQPVFGLPFLGRNPAKNFTKKNIPKKIKKTLAQILN